MPSPAAPSRTVDSEVIGIKERKNEMLPSLVRCLDCRLRCTAGQWVGEKGVYSRQPQHTGYRPNTTKHLRVTPRSKARDRLTSLAPLSASLRTLWKLRNPARRLTTQMFGPGGYRTDACRLVSPNHSGEGGGNPTYGQKGKTRPNAKEKRGGRGKYA